MEKKEGERQGKEAIVDRSGFKKVYQGTLDTLAEYEWQYKMTSGDFILAFEHDGLPDKLDFYRWRVTYQGYRNLLKNWA